LAEQRLGKIFLIFSILTIFIACIGLLGLAAFATEQRTKEIGIRKVLGASVPNLVTLLSKDFSKWVLLANLIAWPAAYFAMNEWLQDFAYRVNIGWWVFALAGGLALLIALLTVSSQAIKAALANPVEALRYE
jgi:putative ABC transport system permease protein